ncbi:PHP domain-containing protein [Ralstonia pickettii]|uniref:PHP domain-containing protein n=1 Tax=Ralstonia pickettii TaxID=329 RepID=UPI0026B52C82
MPYAELHAHSSYSFLDGASSPEELVEEAERLGLHALAITDHDGFYGIVRFAEAAEQRSVRTVFGAELSLELTAVQNGRADPEGTHLLVLARGQEGYHRLAADRSLATVATVASDRSAASAASRSLSALSRTAFFGRYWMTFATWAAL